MTRYWILSGAFSASINIIILIFTLFSINVVNHYLIIKPSLCFWQRWGAPTLLWCISSLLKNLLLDLIGWYFVKDFCNCSHERDWFVLLFLKIHRVFNIRVLVVSKGIGKYFPFQFSVSICINWCYVFLKCLKNLLIKPLRPRFSLWKEL